MRPAAVRPTLDAVQARLVRFAASMRDRIEAEGARFGLVWPWWIPVFSIFGLFGSAVIAAVQRDLVTPPSLALLAVVLVEVPYLLHLVARIWPPWWAESVFVFAGVGWLLLEPITVGASLDAAGITLAVFVGLITASEGKLRGALVASVAVPVMLLLGDPPADLKVFYALTIAFGLVFGFMMRWQMRALMAERQARLDEHHRATLAERQRVAREVHDLVAHSLSVTMLHVTGARRALTEDGDVDDAVDALTDAERVGRQAMTDIRRTVSVLADDSSLQPLPGAPDIDELIADVRAAGVDVAWRCEGDVDGLPDAVGLGLYRVVQESLANVVKHAPEAVARVELAVGFRQARLTVTSPAPAARRPAGSGGSGLTGMAARARQLGGRLDAGPDGDRWRVRLVLPLEDPCR